jgi:hypothetical protein
VNLKACIDYLDAMYPGNDIANTRWKASTDRCSIQKDSKSCGVLALEHARRLLIGESLVNINTSKAGILQLRHRMTKELRAGGLTGVEQVAIPLAEESPLQNPSPTAQIASSAAQTPSPGAWSPFIAAQTPYPGAQTPSPGAHIASSAVQTPSAGAQSPLIAAQITSSAAQTPSPSAQSPIIAAQTPSEASAFVATPTSCDPTETPVVGHAGKRRWEHEELVSIQEVLVPETPRSSQLYKIPSMQNTEARPTSSEIPEALASLESTDDTSKLEFSQAVAAEAVLGVEGLRRLRAGETVRFQIFPDGFDQETLDLLAAEVYMYMHHCPVELSTGKAIPNMVHSVLQQTVRQSLSVWVVSALLYGTTKVIAVPLPGRVCGEMRDGSFQIDKLKIWEATASHADGIYHPWSGLHMEPIWFPDVGQPIDASARVGSARQWVGLRAIEQANSCRGAVRRDERRFVLTKFLDRHAYSAKTISPIGEAMLGMVAWDDQSITEFLACHCSRSSFDTALQMQCTSSGVLGYYAAMRLQREYCWYGRNSWVVSCARSSGEGDAGWLQPVKHLLKDNWNESWVQPEVAHDDQAVAGSQRKREGSFCDGAAMHKKKRV